MPELIGSFFCFESYYLTLPHGLSGCLYLQPHNRCSALAYQQVYLPLGVSTDLQSVVKK